MKKGDVLRAVPTHEQVLWEGEKQVQNLHTSRRSSGGMCSNRSRGRHIARAATPQDLFPELRWSQARSTVEIIYYPPRPGAVVQCAMSPHVPNHARSPSLLKRLPDTDHLSGVLGMISAIQSSDCSDRAEDSAGLCPISAGRGLISFHQPLP